VAVAEILWKLDRKGSLDLSKKIEFVAIALCGDGGIQWGDGGGFVGGGFVHLRSDGVAGEEFWWKIHEDVHAG
jgi:hypothetical protein